MLQGNKKLTDSFLTVAFLWKITFSGQQRRPRFPALKPRAGRKNSGWENERRNILFHPSKLSVCLEPQTPPSYALQLLVATSKTLNWAAARCDGAKLGESTQGTAASRLCFMKPGCSAQWCFAFSIWNLVLAEHTVRCYYFQGSSGQSYIYIWKCNVTGLCKKKKEIFSEFIESQLCKKQIFTLCLVGRTQAPHISKFFSSQIREFTMSCKVYVNIWDLKLWN